MVNVSVTAPGATLALGLMHLKTNNAAVAARLAPPDTHYLLEFVQPNVVMLRVVSQSLVMWDSITPSARWVESHIPAMVRRHVTPAAEPEPDVDREALDETYSYILAGACLSLALRYAGTGAGPVVPLLTRYLNVLRGTATDEHGARAPACSATSTCVRVVVLSLCVVMAGTGDLDLLRLLRVLRRDTAATYGQQMATHMALGFLFLGAGSCSFGTSNECIAALLISLYPVFPDKALDNRYHLQALRHLYVLGVERRCLQAIDVDSREACAADIEIVWRPEGSFTDTVARTKTPCLVPDWGLIRQIRVVGGRFWQRVVEVGPDSGVRHSRVILVKSGCPAPSAGPSPLELAVAHARASHFLYTLSLVDAYYSPLGVGRLLRDKTRGGNPSGASSAGLLGPSATATTATAGATTAAAGASLASWPPSSGAGVLSGVLAPGNEELLKPVLVAQVRDTLEALSATVTQAMHSALAQYLTQGVWPAARADADLLAAFLALKAVPNGAKLAGALAKLKPEARASKSALVAALSSHLPYVPLATLFVITSMALDPQ